MVRNRYILVGVAIVLAGAAALAGQALADTGSGDPSFRTAVVRRSSVSQALQRSGTIEPIAQATVAFPISGTVATVPVQPGQAVTTGQALATLDSTALQATLTSTQASLAADQLTLSNALNGISSGSGPSSRAASSPTTTTTARTSTPSTPSSSTAQARQAVAAGQHRVDNALSTAEVALAGAARACAESNPGRSTSTTTPTSSTSTSTTAPSTTTTTTPSGASPDCLKALQNSLSAQQQVAGAQSALAQAENDFDGLLNAAALSGSGRTATTTPNSSTAPNNSTAASSSGPSSAELVADQAAVDAAQADVTAAQQSLAQATIVSPIDGTVAAVNMTPGEQVSAGSSTANIVVVGPGGFEVTTTVNVTDIGKVKLGDDATVVPDGSSTPLDGKVVSIGVMPATNGTATTYPVVIGLSGSPSGLYNGASAAVTIILSHAADALAVPTSAVRSFGGGGLEVVTVLSGGKTTNVPVQVGAVGAELTEIRGGLQEGQTVVIADLREAVPSNNTAANGRVGAAGGGLSGGGLGGANRTFVPRG